VPLFFFRFFPRHRLGLVLALGFLLLVAGAFVFFTWRGRDVLTDFYEPKLLTLRVGGVTVYPSTSAMAEVMAGLPVEVTCEVVAPARPGEQSHFVLQGGGEPVSAKGCNAKLAWSGPSGQEGRVSVEYHVRGADGTDRLIERREAKVTLVAQREYLRIRSLEDDQQRPLPTLTVPRSVVPFVDAALRLEGSPEHYAVLFFVRRQGGTSPVLQVLVPPDDPKAWRPVVAPLRKFRSWGEGLNGFAAWPGGRDPRKDQPADPIQIGNQEETRVAFELFAGLFRLADVPRVTEAAISLKEVGGERAVFQVKGLELEALRQIAYKGWLSEPVTVVRAEVAPKATTFEWRAE
jgi:hypothetical protein